MHISGGREGRSQQPSSPGIAVHIDAYAVLAVLAGWNLACELPAAHLVCL